MILFYFPILIFHVEPSELGSFFFGIFRDCSIGFVIVRLVCCRWRDAVCKWDGDAESRENSVAVSIEVARRPPPPSPRGIIHTKMIATTQPGSRQL